jgi:NRPS condensation-like uncharacterized protein
VSCAINAMKANRTGLEGMISLSLALRTGFAPMRLMAQQMRGQNIKYGKANPVLSNFGLIDPRRLDFGDAAVQDAYMLGPTLFAPGLMLAVSTFGGTMTFAVGLAPAATDRGTVERLLDVFDGELRSLTTGCAPEHTQWAV